MESENLSTIVSALRTRRDLASQKAVTLKSELAAVEAEESRIEAALAALSGESPKPTNGNSKPKSTRRAPQGRAAKKADVIAAIRRVLDQEHVLPADALKSRVESLLIEDGFNRFGFAMRWNEASQDPQLVPTSEGLKLRGNMKANERSNRTSDSRQSADTPEAP